MNAYGGHPDRKSIAAYVAHRCGAADRLWISEHLNTCTQCYRVFAAERLPEPGSLEFGVLAVPVPLKVREPGRHGVTEPGPQDAAPGAQATAKAARAAARPALPKIVSSLVSGAIGLCRLLSGNATTKRGRLT